jgi:transposase, IS30 family
MANGEMVDRDYRQKIFAAFHVLEYIMGQTYRHLTKEERAQIYILLHEGYKKSQIAEALNRNRSTITREIARNKGRRGYRITQSHKKAIARKKIPRYQKMTQETQHYIEQKIREDWSPMQITNTMEQHIKTRISHERIYQHIACDKKEKGELYKHLRINNRRRYRRNRTKPNWRSKIQERVDIDQRPPHINERTEPGHWEADLVCLRDAGYLVTLVERQSRFSLVGTVLRKQAGLVSREIIRLLSPYSSLTKSITYDNGAEFCQHQEVNMALQCQSFFAKPYHSWERGSNENSNGLLRQYFPKKAKGSLDTSATIALAQKRLNERPKKVLGWKTPKQVLWELGYTTDLPSVALGT